LEVSTVTAKRTGTVKIKTNPKKCGVGKTVLIVDDNATIRQMLAAAFLSDGFKTCGEANNGKEGIELAAEIKPDLITLDLSMPVMNGLDAAPVLRKLFPKTPIILFTMYGHDGVKETAAKAGINLVLSKTAPLTTLIDQAHRLIGS
jgi:CheY-like chemotaxis protein